MLPSTRHRIYYVLDVAIAIIAYILAGSLGLYYFIFDADIDKLFLGILFIFIGTHNVSAAMRHQRHNSYHDGNGF